MNDHYTYYPSFAPVVSDRLAIITGVARSGTTLLGKVVGSLANVEYEYEPWITNLFPVLLSGATVDIRTGCEIVQANLDSLFINRILGRNVNFRTSDDSRITNSLPLDEIDRRWTSLASADDAEAYIKANGSMLCIKQVNVHPFIEIVLRNFAGVKMIHVTRNAYDVALSMEQKGWNETDTLENGRTMDLKKRVVIGGVTRCVPWFIEDAEGFLSGSDYERCVQCWITLMESFVGMRARLLKDQNYLEVRYEDLLAHSENSLGKIAAFLGKKTTPLTDTIMATIRPENATKNPDHRKDELATESIRRVERIMKSIGY